MDEGTGPRIYGPEREITGDMKACFTADKVRLKGQIPGFWGSRINERLFEGGVLFQLR